MWLTEADPVSTLQSVFPHWGFVLSYASDSSTDHLFAAEAITMDKVGSANMQPLAEASWENSLSQKAPFMSPCSFSSCAADAGRHVLAHKRQTDVQSEGVGGGPQDPGSHRFDSPHDASASSGPAHERKAALHVVNRQKEIWRQNLSGIWGIWGD